MKNKKMVSAYVLITCDRGMEDSVIEEIRHVDYVKEVQETFGAYNIIAKLVSRKADLIKKAISWQMRKISNVKSTLLLMEV